MKVLQVRVASLTPASDTIFLILLASVCVPAIQRNYQFKLNSNHAKGGEGWARVIVTYIY